MKKLAYFLLATVLCTSLGAEQSTQRLTLVVAKVDGGGVTTNKISYARNGFLSGFDLATEVPTIGHISTTVSFIYSDANQLIKTISKTKGPYGSEEVQSVYTYEGSEPDRLLRVNSLSNTGAINERVFEYDVNGLVIRRTEMWTAPDGQKLSEEIELSYDESKNVTAGVLTAINADGNKTGSFKITYDAKGDPIEYSRQEPDGTMSSATFIRSAAGMKETGVTQWPASEPQMYEVISTYESGPCRSPKLTDGYIVDTIFDSPNGFFASDLCR